MKTIDLTHPFSKTMPTYPGDPASQLAPIASIEKEGYNDSRLSTGLHVGTHLDAPLHMLPHGKRISDYPPDFFFGPGCLVDARGLKEIGPELLEEKPIPRGSILLILTGLSTQFHSSAYFEDFPELTEAFALKAIEMGVKMVGLDCASPDRPPFSIHKLLLSHDILILENLTNLEALLDHPSFEVVALPAKLEAEAAPARMVACIA